MSANPCSQFEDRIHELMDSRQPVAEDSHLIDHASTCLVCRKLLQDFAALDCVFSGHSTSQVFASDCAEHDHTDIGYFDSGKYPAWTDPVVTPAHSRRPSMGIERFGIWGAIASMLIVALTAALLWQPVSDGPSSVADSSGDVDHVVVSPDFVSTDHAVVDSQPGAEVAVSVQPGVQIPDVLIKINEDSNASSQQLANSTANTSWTQLPAGLQPLDPYYRISSELPGVHPIRSSLDATIDLFYRNFKRKSAEPESTPEPVEKSNGASFGQILICNLALLPAQL